MHDGIRRINDASSAALDAALAAGRRLTDGGKIIDDHQVQSYPLAYAATVVPSAAALAA